VECLGDSKLTFLLLGDTCTRNCRFCGVRKKSDAEFLSLDLNEPFRIAKVVEDLGLKYVVITSVTRDDLDDGGAGIFAKAIDLIRLMDRNIKVEVLIPDFKGKTSSLKCLLEASPDLVAHNIETVERLYPLVRAQASYGRSLELLKRIKQLKPKCPTKSSLMLGLGETRQDLKRTMQDLIDVDCDMLTLGQYLPPSKEHYPVKEYICLEEFLEYKELGRMLGFKAVLSGPLVRSSYKAEVLFKEFTYV